VHRRHELYGVGRHREGIGSKFTGRYRVHQLVWFEEFADPSGCGPEGQREKSLKRYLRPWKINLIERTNPHWIDLYPGLLAKHGVPSGGTRRALGPRDKPEDDT
jgi:predicted GIY-YIG superfamily endonuclease